MDNEKLPEQKIVIQNKFVKWFDNFWFYYKWQTIGVIFAVFVLTICIVQMVTKENPDITILYAGPLSSSISEENDVSNVFDSILPSDYNDDGEKITQLAIVTVYSEQQIKDKAAAAASSGMDISVNASTNSTELQKFDSLIATGEYSVCFLDPWLYERVKVANGFRKLSDVLGEVPEGAYDDYAVKLSDTNFGKYFSALGVFPEDTLVCLRVKGTISGFFHGDADETYAQAIGMFDAIVNFEYPEGYVPTEY